VSLAIWHFYRNVRRVLKRFGRYRLGRRRIAALGIAGIAELSFR
jgi:hypothetical protein